MEDDVMMVFCEWFDFGGKAPTIVSLPPNNLN